MATNSSGNRNIEARLIMDNTGNWKLIANAAPPGVEPSNRRQLLKVTGPDGKIKFFYGNKPDEGGINPILKQASLTPEMKSKPDENKRLLTESQAKSLAMLLSSVKSQMTSSSSSETSLVEGVTRPHTVVSSASEQIPATASTTSVVAQGLSSLGHGKSNQLVLLVTSGSKNAPAKSLQAPVPLADVAPIAIQPGSNFVCGNSGKPMPLKPKTVYVLQQSPRTQPTNLSTNKMLLSSIPESQHGRIEGDYKYWMLSHLLKTNEGMSVSKNVSPISSGIANVKQVEIPSTVSYPYTQNADRHVDPILSRFDTTSSVPYAAASTSVPIPVSKSVAVPAVKLGMAVPPPPAISRGNTATLSSQLVLMPTYYMPTLVAPTVTASSTPFEQGLASAGPTQSNVAITVPGPTQSNVAITVPGHTQSNVAITVPGEQKLIIPTSNITDPVNRRRKVGPHLAGNKSVKELLNELPRERVNKKDGRNEIPDASLNGNVAITVPGEQKLIIPTSNITDPVNRRRKVGPHLTGNKSVKELLNELARERVNKKEGRNEIPDASLNGNDNCTDDICSTLRIESVFSLQHTKEHLKADQNLEVKTEVECVHKEGKDGGSGIPSSMEKCGSPKETSNMGEGRIVKQEKMQQRKSKPIMMANNFRHRPFPKKIRLKYHMLEPFVVLERMDFHDQTTSENGEMGTSKLQNEHSCNRLCREKRLMKLCREKRIPCINRLKSEVMSTAKKCRRIRRKVKKPAPLEDGKEVKTPSSPFDVFLKNLVEKERRRHEKNTKKKTPSTSADNLIRQPRRYLPYNALGKHIRVGRYRVIVPKNSGVVETFQLKTVVPNDADILPPVPVPAAFEDIVDAEEVQPISAEIDTVELGGDEPEVGNPESALGQPTSPSSETETGSSETCSDGNISDALVCKNVQSDDWDPILDKHEQSDQEEVQSESGRESTDDVSKSDEEQERLEMDTHPEREEGPDIDDIPVVDTSTLTNDSVGTDDTLDLHQSDVTTSVNEDSEAVISDDEVADLKAVETPPKEEESDDDWGTTELEVDPDSEHEEDMDIMCSSLPPIVTESLPEPDKEGNSCLYPSANIGNHSANFGNSSANIGNHSANIGIHSANIGGNDRIQRLKAQLEEQTRKVDSLRKLRHCTR